MVLAVWAGRFHPAWGAAATATAQYFDPARFSITALAGNWYVFLTAAVAAIGLAAAARWTGAQLTGVLGRRSGLLLAAALGAGTLGLTMLGLGLTGLWIAPPRGVALAVLATLAVFEVSRWVRAPWPRVPGLAVSPVIRIALLALFVVTACGVFNIEMGWDALSYHLRLPSIYMAHHRIIDVWHHYCSPFPSLIEMLFAAGMLVRDDQTARILNAFLGLGMLGALASLATEAGVPSGPADQVPGARERGRPAEAGVRSRWVFALCLGSPVVALLFIRSYVDLGVAMFITLALAELLRWHRTGSTPSLLTAGFAAGCAMGAKYTAVLILPAAIAIAWPGPRGRERWRAGAMWCAAALFPLLPWLIKNWVLKGNPVSPLLGDVFGTHEIIPGDIMPLGGATMTWLGLAWSVPARATALLFDHGRIDGPVAATIVGLIPLLALRPPPGPLRDLRRAVLAYGAGWLLLSPDARFFLPILPAVCVLEAAAFETIALRSLGMVRALQATLAAGLTLGAVYALFIQWIFFAPCSLALGFDTAATKLQLGLQPAPYNWYVTAWLNARVPATEQVWFVADFSTYYVQRECLADFHFGRSRLMDLFAEAPTAQAIAKRLRQRGFRWICSTGPGVAQYFNRPDYFTASPTAWKAFKTFLATRTDVAFQTEGYTVFRIGRPHPARPLPDLPVVSTVAFHAADVLLESGRADAALKMYLAAPPLLADVGATYVRRGDAYMVLGDSDSAHTAFARALALGADNPRVRSGLGNALLRLGRAGDALPHNEAAWRQHPLSANAAGTLALNFSQVGRADDARRLIREAVRLRPDDPDYRALALQLGTLPEE